MARVTYGPFITELNGTVAGMTFQRNASGPVMRTKPSGNKKSTRFQLYTQGILNSVNKLWFALSQANKDLWNAFAIANTYIDLWGKSIKLSGFQWFMSVNTNLTYCYAQTLTQPAAYVPPPSFPNYNAYANQNGLICYFSGNQDLRAYYVIWYATPPVKSSSILDRSKYLKLATFSNFNANQQALSVYYQNIFGINIVTLHATSKCNIVVFARMINRSTGYSCPMLSSVAQVS